MVERQPPDADELLRIDAWFLGAKAEQGEYLQNTIRRIVEDYCYWRRNYFPEDGVIVDSHTRREQERFHDRFEDKLLELLGQLKGDFPFYSPRYAGHMLSEQTIASITGYFAAMLYNPNNVSADAAPVTVTMEIEACRMISKMLGYGDQSWAHLASGGTIATLEALWMARAVKYLPFIVRDIQHELGLQAPAQSAQQLLALNPMTVLQQFADTFAQARDAQGANSDEKLIDLYRRSSHNVTECGIGAVLAKLQAEPPLLIVSETAHYCISKSMDVLGIGRKNIVPVRVDRHFRMDVADLRAKLDEADAAGRHILAVVPVVGTTEEGAVDPVDQIVALRAEREQAGKPSFWIHADAAYGGYLRTTTVPSRLGLGEPQSEVRIKGRDIQLDLDLPEHSVCDALERLGECDSIAIDPHKLGYIPYPAGVVCFKSNLVKPIARQDAPYIEEALPDLQAEAASESIGVYVLEGSKPGAAAAGVWLSHTLIPLDTTGHGVLVRETVRNASELYSLLVRWEKLAGEQSVKAIPLCPPGSNIVCYLFAPKDRKTTLEQLNHLNRTLYQRFTLGVNPHIYSQSFFVSRTVIHPSHYRASTVQFLLDELGVSEEEYSRHGVFMLRSVLMNPWFGPAKRKGRHYLVELVEQLYSNAAELAAANSDPQTH